MEAINQAKKAYVVTMTPIFFGLQLKPQKKINMQKYVGLDQRKII